MKREPLLPQILSRGQIVSVNREPRKTLTSVSVFVDHHLAPSFYFVAFYYHRGLPVANSLQVDVQPKACEGKVTGIGRDGIVCWGLREKEDTLPILTVSHLLPCQLELKVDGLKEYHPGDTMKLHLLTDSPALVALGAVDTALYAVGGRSHKPLDMGKVCQDPPPPQPSLTFSCRPEPRVQPTNSSQSSLKPWPHGLYFSTVCVSHFSIPCPLTHI